MSSIDPHISIVSPVYMGELLVDELVARVRAAVEQITSSYEIILVEDRGPDGSWAAIQRISKQDVRVLGVRLSKNFGQHHAIAAGLLLSKGDWVVVMDCDLQDVPEEIPKLYAKAMEGFNVVLARRAVRSDSLLKRTASFLFYKTLSFLTGMEHDNAIANFGIYNRKVIHTIKGMNESIRYFPSMVKWVGFTRTAIDVTHAKRLEGRSSYNFRRLFRLAIDIILAYSDKPLRLTIRLGLMISLTAFAFALVNVYKAITGEIQVLGYASIIISIWLLGGLIIMILGVVGLYIGKTFEGVKQRPNYVIESTTWE